MYLSLGLFFLAPHLTRQRKFYAAFFFQIAEIPQGRHCSKTVRDVNPGGMPVANLSWALI